ncbi:CaiB/BaiF CoA transferase family protein [Xanthobacter wiegelii]|uniref:CaiB/BaiF CoA transferase family protein n=1 Tax=Xanthobacter wiegelii TaxID=3119913 RepID=UPI0037284B69
MVLEGLKVVSFCHFLQGPAAMQYLSDMGAAVIKIEPPNGAFERHWGGVDKAKVGGATSFFLCANRNARSLAIDLKKPDAKEVIFRLVESAHVLAENFRPGALDRLGFGYENVRRRKPDIIYASASGFGRSGPFADRPGQDLLIQAMSGLAAATGKGEVGPTPVGCAAADQHGAALFALGIAGAYARWLKTGVGTRVESSLLGAGIDLQMESLVAYYASGATKENFNRDVHLGSWFHEAPYGIYALADAHVAISMAQVANLAQVLDSAELAGFVGESPYRNRNAIAAALANVVKDYTFERLHALFTVHAIWHARVEDFDDLLENPQLEHNETFSDVSINGETVKLLNHPVRYDAAAPGKAEFALQPGAHTRDVLGSSGFSDAEIRELLRSEVVFAPE